MSAPPLPEIFGNYALGPDFAEVLPPAAIDWWPQTLGWLVVGLVLAVFLTVRAARALRRWYHNRYRREAQHALQQLEGLAEDTAVAGEVAALLKRTALAAFPRRQVASLSGEAWVSFLNTRCPQPPFDTALATLLREGQYRQRALAPAERLALFNASRVWIDNHQGPGHA